MNRKVIDGLIGFAIGDAMGVPLEFSNREDNLKKLVTDMIGYGAHFVPAGSWSDDTSMTIATMDSYIEKGKFDYDDIMDKWYEWAEDYKYTASNITFDIGNTCFEAIYNYHNNNLDPLECGIDSIDSNGNGSLMRMLPVVYYAYYKNIDKDELYELVKDISSLTHAHEISIMGCYIYTLYAIRLLKGEDKVTAYKNIQKEDYSMFSSETIEVYKRILSEDISLLKLDSIKSTGYVVDTLEASIWVILKSKNYWESIVGSINLGHDTDTVGAITGSLAGIIYGYSNIPKEWLDILLRKDYLIEIANKYEREVKNGES